MEVFFATKDLAGCLGSERSRVTEFGVEVAMGIDLRLQQLLSAPTLEHVRNLPGRCRELDGELCGNLAIDVRRPIRLIFRPHMSDPSTPHAGAIDWATVDRIVITGVNDYSRGGKR